MRDEQFRDAVLFMQHARHQRLFDPGKRTVCHRGSRGYTQRLTCKAPLAEEFTGAQNGDDRFLTLFRCNRKPHFAPLEVEHGIRRLSLPEDVAVRAVFCNRLADRDASEEGFPIDRLVFLTRHDGLRQLAEGQAVASKPRIRPRRSSGKAKHTSYLLPLQASHPLARSEEHTSELQSRLHLVCRLLLEKKKLPIDKANQYKMTKAHRA